MNKQDEHMRMDDYMTVKECQEYLRLSRTSVMRFAEQCNAIVHLGRAVRINMKRIRGILDAKGTI